VCWSYEGSRRAYPGVDTDAGVQAIGYQILKMDDLSRFARRGPTSREENGSRSPFGCGVDTV
jgi:hypothetical protein